MQQPVRIEQPAAGHTQQHNTHTQRQPNSSTNKSVGKVYIMEFTLTHTDADNGHILNNHDEPEAFMTHGTVNNIHTDILLDSGAKRSVVSKDFLPHNSQPIGTETICGISQTPSLVEIHEVTVDIPGLNGICRVAVETSLPHKTVLLGTDLGTAKLLELLNGIKAKPTTVFAVTRSMAAQDAAADRIIQALQASEGANPIPLESLPDMTQDENEHTVAQDTVPMVDHSSTSSPPSESSLSVTPSQLSISFPNFSFDGVTREKFMLLQRDDPLLKPLWEQAEKGNKAYFIANNILMSITTTLNHHSHALLVPTSLRHSVLVAAHDGLGQGGIGATRALINKYFTWPGMKKDITTHIESCNTRLLNNRGEHTKLPLCEPQVITERFEKLAIDVW